MGGPFYEAILAGIPSHDRIGQITAYSRYLEQLFGVKVRGMWMPERVWEQNFTGDITRAGIEYTVLDDHHFKSAGLRDEHLYGYYLSEDEGRLLKIFPGSEKLRYTIPFQEPRGDDPLSPRDRRKTPQSSRLFRRRRREVRDVAGHEKACLRKRLAEAVPRTRCCENGDWLKLCTLGEAVDNVPPVGS